MALSPAFAPGILLKDCRLGNGLCLHGKLSFARRIQTRQNGKQIVLGIGWAKASADGARSVGISSPATVDIIPITKKFLCKAEANISGDVPSHAPTGTSLYERIVELLTTLFPVWVILGTVIGIYKPAAVTWLETDLFTIGLGFLMLSMGLTLTFEDFRRCMRNPWTVGVGFLAQYLVKPFLGFFIAMALKLSAPLATGLILVSCCPGGQASNVATYISKGNVALSVLMTTPLGTLADCASLGISGELFSGSVPDLMAEDNSLNMGSNEIDPKNDPKRKAKSNDPGWKYGHWPDLMDKNTVKCNLCDRLIKGGVKRLKQHLCGGFGDVVKCSKTTTQISAEMYMALNEKKRSKATLLEEEQNESEDETQRSVSQELSSNKPSLVPSSGTSAKRKKVVVQVPPKRGPMDFHLRRAPEDIVDERRGKGLTQLSMERCMRSEEEKKKVDKYVATWFYECGIPFNAVKARSFEVMLEAIGQYGFGYKGPSFHDLRVPLLLDSKEQVMQLKATYEVYWRRFGCSLMTDGWTDKRGRHLINFLANCPEGTFFLGSVDASSEIQDAEMLCDLIESKIREVG